MKGGRCFCGITWTTAELNLKLVIPTITLATNDVLSLDSYFGEDVIDKIFDEFEYEDFDESGIDAFFSGDFVLNVDAEEMIEYGLDFL